MPSERELYREAVRRALADERDARRELARRHKVERARARIEKRERDAMMAAQRVKELRPYVRGFEADDGFDLRRPKELTGAQRRRVESVYRRLAPLLVKPHVRVRARSARELRQLKEFQRIERAPAGMKAVPILTPTPDNTTVEITPEGVRVRRGRLVQRIFTIPAGMRRAWDVERVARRMLAKMPAGKYFILTGEHEAFRSGLEHGGPDSADDPDNLLARELAFWLNEYGASRVRKFFKGFRWIGSVDDDEAVFREQARIAKARKAADRERAERRHRIGAVARKRARREISK